MVDHKNASDDGKQDEPKPNDEEDLSVHDVQGEDAECIPHLQSTDITKVAEGTLGDLKNT